MAALNVNSNATINGTLTLKDSKGTLDVNTLLRKYSDMLTWKFWDKNTGVPTTSNPLCVGISEIESVVGIGNIHEFFVTVQNNTELGYDRYNFIIPYAMMSKDIIANKRSYLRFKQGSYQSTSWHAQVILDVDFTSLRVSDYSLNGKTAKETNVYVWYR